MTLAICLSLIVGNFATKYHCVQSPANEMLCWRFICAQTLRWFPKCVFLRSCNLADCIWFWVGCKNTQRMLLKSYSVATWLLRKCWVWILCESCRKKFLWVLLPLVMAWTSLCLWDSESCQGQARHHYSNEMEDQGADMWWLDNSPWGALALGKSAIPFSEQTELPWSPMSMFDTMESWK